MNREATCYLLSRGAFWNNGPEKWLLTDHPDCRLSRAALRSCGGGGFHLQFWPGHCGDREGQVGAGTWGAPGHSSRPTPCTRAPAPSVSHDDHAQLVPKVLHLVDLDKRPRVVDLVQALDHVRLVAEGKGTERNMGTGALALLKRERRETPLLALTSLLLQVLWAAPEGHRIQAGGARWNLDSTPHLFLWSLRRTHLPTWKWNSFLPAVQVDVPRAPASKAALKQPHPGLTPGVPKVSFPAPGPRMKPTAWGRVFSPD